MENQSLTLEEAQQQVDSWIKTYGVRYFSELTNMTVLTEEVGELARVMARKYGDQSFKAGEKDNLGEEMADIFWVLLPGQPDRRGPHRGVQKEHGQEDRT
jgi:NTP pyrophosphatase (non-canonical NTP hydrolase)